MIPSLSTDFLIRIKNGSRAGRKTIDAPCSKFNLSIAELLKKSGYIADYKTEGDVIKTIVISLAYQDGQAKIYDIRLFSKPGRRFYSKSSELPWGQTSDSLIVISTSSGVMSQREAHKKGLGGEIIAEIW